MSSLYSILPTATHESDAQSTMPVQTLRTIPSVHTLRFQAPIVAIWFTEGIRQGPNPAKGEWRTHAGIATVALAACRSFHGLSDVSIAFCNAHVLRYKM